MEEKVIKDPQIVNFFPCHKLLDIISLPKRNIHGPPSEMPTGSRESASEMTPAPRISSLNITPSLGKPPSEITRGPRKHPSEIIQGPRKPPSEITQGPKNASTRHQLGPVSTQNGTSWLLSAVIQQLAFGRFYRAVLDKSLSHQHL